MRHPIMLVRGHLSGTQFVMWPLLRTCLPRVPGFWICSQGSGNQFLKERRWRRIEHLPFKRPPVSSPGKSKTFARLVDLCQEQQQKNRSDITSDPGGHRPQRPCAQGRTRGKQDQAQATAPGQNPTRSVGGATTHGRRTRQASESGPT